jgi:ABC-type uncharacterized transport system involved in gliding motility auxiliary subunit
MSEYKVETQKERWFKYGGNVALSVSVVIVLAVVVVWLGQLAGQRIDTTQIGLYSLKPQTVKIIQGNTQPIRIVSLYTRTKKSDQNVEDDSKATRVDDVQLISDLLEEYKRKGKQIDIESIDPHVQQTKVDQLIDEVTKKYGGEVLAYKAIVEEYPATYEQIAKMAQAEARLVEGLPFEKVKSAELQQTLILTLVTVQTMPKRLEETKEKLDSHLKQKIPDYKAAVDEIDQGMSFLLSLSGQIIEEFGKLKEDKQVPEEFRKYMAESLPRYEELRKLVDGFATKIKALGELKLDVLKQNLKEDDTILVMGEKEMRVIPRRKVWQGTEDSIGPAPDGASRQKFAGEQQITSAILAVTSPVKRRVVFIRPGGPPVTQQGIPGFVPAGRYYLIADRLRDYNFEVMEKDLSGMWAMQSRMQGGMMGGEDATDEQMKDAIWIVWNVQGPRSQGGPPPSVVAKLSEHLMNKGSALILSSFQGEDLAPALDEWGVRIRPDKLIVHEAVDTGGARSADLVEEAQRQPFIFVLQHYGDHPITRSVNGLDGVILPMIPVEVTAKPGFESAKLIPVPQTLKVWAESAGEAALEGKKVEFDSAAGDIPPPLWAGAAVKKNDGGRLVVLGSAEFAMNHLVIFPDPRQRRPVARFPANGELAANSIFWLAGMETLIEISPSAMEVSRIAQMPEPTQNLLRIGLLLVALPLGVIACGAAMFMRRRD